MKLSNIDLVVINAKEALDNAILFAEKGEYCYKKVNKQNKFVYENFNVNKFIQFKVKED